MATSSDLSGELLLSASASLFNLLCSGKATVILDLRDESDYAAGHVKSARPSSRLHEFQDSNLLDHKVVFRYDQKFYDEWKLSFPFLVVEGRYIGDIVAENRKQELEDLRLKELELAEIQRIRESGQVTAMALVGAPSGPPPPPPPPPPKASITKMMRPAWSKPAYTTVLYYAARKSINMGELESSLKDLVQSVQGLQTRAHELKAGPTQTMVNEEEINYIYPSCIIEGLLYQGGLPSVSQKKILDDLQIRHVVCAAAELVPAFPNDFNYLHIAVDDTPHDDLFAHFENAYQLMSAAFERREPVIVHCAMGISRSSTVTLMFLIRRFRLTLERATALLKERRPFVQPNPGFVTQLKQWRELHC